MRRHRDQPDGWAGFPVPRSRAGSRRVVNRPSVVLMSVCPHANYLSGLAGRGGRTASTLRTLPSLVLPLVGLVLDLDSSALWPPLFAHLSCASLPASAVAYRRFSLWKPGLWIASLGHSRQPPPFSQLYTRVLPIYTRVHSRRFSCPRKTQSQRTRRICRPGLTLALSWQQ